MRPRLIHMIRIDVPLKTTCQYFYVEEPDPKRAAWWTELWNYLLSFAPQELAWRHEPVQDLYFARPTLTQSQRVALGTFLHTARKDELVGHRPLQRAANLAPEQYPRLEVVYFSPAVEQNKAAPGS